MIFGHYLSYKQKTMQTSELKIELSDPACAEAQACINAYYDELQVNLDSGFDPNLSVSANPEEMTPPAGYFYLARIGNQVVACAGLKVKPDFTEIKRMWVNPNARKLGIARKLIDVLEQQSAKIGINIVRLDTHSSLKKAKKLYLSSGYVEIKPYNDNLYADLWFEKDLNTAYEQPR